MPESIEEGKQNSKGGLSPSTIRIGRRYRKSRLEGDYDAIVIGSGMGGLTTAACLSSLGKKVIVLEQHYTAGGMTHSYARAGYEWDVGVHYIGDVGGPTMARKMFDFVCGGKLAWEPMDDVYDRIYLGDKQFDLYAGKENFVAEMKRRFPDEGTAIDAYMDLLSLVGKGMRTQSMSKTMPPWLYRLMSIFNKSASVPEELMKTSYEVLKKLTDNEELIAVLAGQWGDHGLPPKKSCFMMQAMISKHYMHGGYYPIGGASKIAETAIPQIQAAGGEVFTYAWVDEILVENGKTTGVKMRDGNTIQAPTVVSSAGVFNTFNHLLPEGMSAELGYKEKLKQVEPSMAHFGMYIGLKGSAEELQLPKTNFWIYNGEDHDAYVERFSENPETPFPAVYISFPSAKDPSFNERYPGRSTIEIVAPCQYELVEKWKDKPWGKRGADYDELKEHYSQRMLEVLFQKMPHLRGKIDYYETSTPLSTDYFCAYSRGECYGLNHDPQRFSQEWLKPKTEIDGLYLTGQDIISCGVVGAMMAGLITSTQILGFRKSGQLMKKIMSAQPA